MAVDLPAIRQRLIVDDSQLNKLPASMGRVGGMLGKAVAGGAAVAAGGLAAFAVKGTMAAADVDRGLREVVTLFGETGAAAGDLADELGAGVAKLSDEVGIAQDVLVGGLYQAISAGVPKDNAFEFMEVASQAAVAGVTDVETAVDGITTNINAFGLEASDAQRVADSMFAAVQGGKTTFEELSSAMSTVAPAAAAAGVSLEEINAGVATLTAGGASTSEATTQMRAALVGLQRPSEELTSIFQEAGYESAQAALESDGLAAALDVVSDAAAGDNGKLTTLLGSVEAVGAAQVIAGTGAEKMAEELARQEDAAGAAGDAFETMEESTTRQMEKLRTNVANVGIALGKDLLPVANRVIKWATDALPGAIATVKATLSGVIRTFTAVAEAVERFRVPILAVVTLLAASYVPALVAAATATVVNVGRKVAAWVLLRLEALRTIASTVAGFATMIARGAAAAAATVAQIGRQVAAWALLGAKSLLGAAKVAAAWLIALGPVGLVIAAVVALVALIIANWDTIKEVIGKAWEWVKRTTASVWNAITGFLSGVWEGITGAVSSAWNAITGAIGRSWDWVKRTTTETIGSVLTWLRELPGKIVDALAGLATTVVAFIAEHHPAIVLIRKLREVWPEIRTWLSELPGRILEAIGDLGELLKDAGANLLGGLVDGIKSVASAPVDAVKDVVGNVRNLLPFSPAKEGPLAGSGSPERAGAKVGRMIAEGLRDSRDDVLAAARDVAGAAAQAGAFDVTATTRKPLGIAPGTDPALRRLETALAGRSDRDVRLELTVNNPTAEPTEESLNRQIRKLTHLGAL